MGGGIVRSKVQYFSELGGVSQEYSDKKPGE